MGKLLRLDKYLADMGVGTRSQLKEWIRKGRVAVNGETVRSPEQKVAFGTDRVEVDGVLVGYVEKEYYMLNKPAGVVSATEDARHKTVLDLISSRQRKDLFPVGRLDMDTEGLLLITNDGELAHRLLSPKKHVDKVYYVKNRPADSGGYQKAVFAGDPNGGRNRVSARLHGKGDGHQRVSDDTGGKVPPGKADVFGSGMPGHLSEADLHGTPSAG